MARQQEINARLITHHRDTKTGKVKRETPYKRHVVNGLVSYEDPKTGVMYNEDWTPKSKPVEAAKQIAAADMEPQKMTEEEIKEAAKKSEPSTPFKK